MLTPKPSEPAKSISSSKCPVVSIERNVLQTLHVVQSDDTH